MAKNGKPKIETGIPIPNFGRCTGASDLLRSLEVGQSVVLSSSTQAVNSLVRQIKRGNRKPCKHEFTARKVDGEHTRVWRVK